MLHRQRCKVACCLVSTTNLGSMRTSLDRGMPWSDLYAHEQDTLLHYCEAADSLDAQTLSALAFAGSACPSNSKYLQMPERRKTEVIVTKDDGTQLVYHTNRRDALHQMLLGVGALSTDRCALLPKPLLMVLLHILSGAQLSHHLLK